jgi:hypothetical protein
VSDLIDQMNQLNQTVSNMILQGLSQLAAGGASEAQSTRTHRKSRHHDREDDCDCHHHDDCDCCRDCERDDCYCRCCIGDADLVIYARLYELRVVPLTIVNDRRREKKIHLDLGEFKTRGGDTLGVKGALVPPVDFTLPPCGEQQVILAIETVPEGETRFSTSAAAADNAERRLKDVDECKVLYADLKVEGCDIRPVRIALALLPRDCEDYEIHCGCSCC